MVECSVHLTVCSCHVTYAFQSEYRVWIHSETRTWHDKNIQLNLNVFIVVRETCYSCNLSQRLVCTCKSSIKWYERLKCFQVKLNIFNILCFIYKCKQNLNSPVFRNTFTHRTKPNMRSEIKILFKNLYAEQILASIAFHTVDSIFGTK